MPNLGRPSAGLPIAVTMAGALLFGCAADVMTDDVAALDCAEIPQGPFPLEPILGAIASEDLAFDADGHLVGSDDDTIYKTGYHDEPRVFVPSFSFRAGLRYTSDGDLVVNDDETGSLVRVDSDGVKHTVLSGLSYPNGITADLDGWIYITEQGAGRVRRIHPRTGEFTILTEGQILEPNGITFNSDYSALYISGFSGVGTIYELPLGPDGTPGELRELTTGIGSGWLDGLAVDACNNIYVADFDASQILRVSPDGADTTMIIDGDLTYMPNMQWGSGIGGWDANKLYIPDGQRKLVYEVDIGVPSKTRPYPR